MTEEADFQVLDFLVCDDIRKEDNGKDILIGVYSGEINIPPAPPFQLPLCYWIRMRLPEEKEYSVRFEVRNPSGSTVFGVDGKMNLIDPKKPAILSIKIPATTTLTDYGIYKASLILDGEPKEIGTFAVVEAPKPASHQRHQQI